jgi:hypothetical protein
MTLYDFIDKHMVWFVVFGSLAMALVYGVVVRVENYLIQRLKVRIALGTPKKDARP